MSTRPSYSLPSISSLTNDRALPPLSALLNSTPLPPTSAPQLRSGSLNGLTQQISPNAIPPINGGPTGSGTTRSAPVSPMNAPSDLHPPSGLQAPLRLPPIGKALDSLQQQQQQHHQPQQHHHYENQPQIMHQPQHIPHHQLIMPPLISVVPHYQHQPIVEPVQDLPQEQHIVTPVKPSSPQDRSPTSAEKRSYAFISHSPSTYPSHEPSIDNHQLARRKRRRTSPLELSILQSEFELGTTPNKARRSDIAARVNMTEKAVQIWFQNRRQTLRRQCSSEKEVHHLEPIFVQHPFSSGVGAGVEVINDCQTQEPAEPESENPIETDNDTEHKDSSDTLTTPLKTPSRQSQQSVTTPSSILKFRLQDSRSKSANPSFSTTTSTSTTTTATATSNKSKILTPISEKHTTRQTKSQPVSFNIVQNLDSSPLENQENRTSPLKFRESSSSAQVLNGESGAIRFPLREINSSAGSRSSADSATSAVIKLSEEGDAAVTSLLHLKNWK
ncbi:hypothetical protein WICPIJ_002258 [Wickerhamomyces pijperi]|uniref:Homeobox domain-containing protein n=1 Tax=Wickerhamomyces pijperi TaxID=599730 RepID=A0A9P8TQ19_WICPI|nr:hypothetical protein WICPIJ_002258 [Wickerhamomyces pijperi]